VLRRPSAVHRLDKPTSGLLCVAKTKGARIDLSRQFHDRVVRKTYTAIVNGIPEEHACSTISSIQALDLGVDVDPRRNNCTWQLVDSPLDGKHAVTVWRAIRYVPSLHAKDGYLTLVQFLPKTGRFHQLRRHMAWVCNRAIVGDEAYDGGAPDAMKFRQRGLFLCSNRVALEHPHYNTEEGRAEWDSLQTLMKNEQTVAGVGRVWYSKEDDKVMVEASVDLPDKFDSLLHREKERHRKFSEKNGAYRESDG